ncbi:MAG: anti-sigma factor family protein [Christensenellales bacterium]|jgi:hypothetical protein
MNCQTAKDYINMYADNMLDDAEKEQLYLHINSCVYCKKELNDIMALRKALSELNEMQPPKSIALKAIKKAKRRIPIFAYGSVVVAVAAVLAVILSSNIIPDAINTQKNAAEQPIALSESYAEEPSVQYAADAACPKEAYPEADMADESMSIKRAEGEDDIGTGDSAILETEYSAVYSLTVPTAISQRFEQDLDTFIVNNEIIAGSIIDGDGKVTSFVIPEACFSEFISLLDDAGISYDSSLTPGCLVKLIYK